ncbi:Protein of unknown function [Cyclobacterium lianum]|uniref:DUF3748 domain-containing protein n=1 Tax=Cyclobacterium lianum TaxID=388280 RepID=A0A1M7NA69_9BACT|nr:DUF3748 domain-containing protein [Cyclobacterium lianum]SHM99965.1 Protein of unknown function [Cyclobacterium lianum]
MMPLSLKYYFSFFLAASLFGSVLSQDLWHLRQLTHASQNHELDHNQNFSPDDEWIAYDTRPHPSGIGQNGRIEKVHVASGRTRLVYQAPDSSAHGPGVGAVSYHPFEDKVVFIHGLMPSSEERAYAAHRRLGMIVDASSHSENHWMDSRDLTAPFTPGALRGGTHRHQWSGDGNWIGFTYNDALMVKLEAKTGGTHDLRTIGVAKRAAPEIKVDVDLKGRNVQGTWFSVLLVEVVAAPKPGSDEISRAYSDWWVGRKGYQKKDGSWQLSRAFLGDLVAGDGRKFTEVFIVDIPEEIHVQGQYGPLQGSLDKMPMPPKGARWRRLTYTENRKYPGVAAVPRHWASSSMDGKFISYLARDERGIVQIYLVPALGGEPVQVSFHDSPVQSMVSWHPHIPEFAYVCGNTIYANRIDSRGNPGTPKSISETFSDAPFALAYSRSGNSLAFNRKIMDFIQVFVAKWP